MRDQGKQDKVSVLCSSVHPIDLDDGRTLRPGETADGIDVESDHNAALVADGHLTVLEGEAKDKKETDDKDKRDGEN